MTPCIAYHPGLERHPIDPDAYGLTYAWLEGRQGALLCRTAEAEKGWDDLTQWPEGRIFGSYGEYRWSRNRDGSIHAVMILDKCELPDIFQTPLALIADTSDNALILWGEWVNPEKAGEDNEAGGPLYYANELPEAQHYPLEGDRTRFQDGAEKKKTPRLITRRYTIEPQNSASVTSDMTGKDHSEEVLGEFVRCVGFDLKTEIEEE